MAALNKVKSALENSLAWLIFFGVALLCTIFILCGHTAEDGSRTLDGSAAKIEEYTENFVEDANKRLDEMMNGEPHTDAETIEINDGEEVGLGFSTSLDAILGRRLPDGDNDGGKGWQCSKYAAYLATGKREYSTKNPDYGPRNGKDIAQYLVDYYGFKYIDKPVPGAIGSGGFNTKYGHAAMFLYSTGANTAMVNDANYTPLRVATHNMDITGWKWVVPGDYTPAPDPQPAPTPSPAPAPVADCKRWKVTAGDTMSKIMKVCEGYVKYGQAMNDYAKKWYSTVVRPGQSVYNGWESKSGIGLYAGDIIEKR